MTATRSLLGLCFFKDSDYLSEFAKTGQTKLAHKSRKEGGGGRGERQYNSIAIFFSVKVAEGLIVL